MLLRFNRLCWAVTYFECIEGSFGTAVGASICGNYSFGANKVNESATSWATTTPTKTLNTAPGTTLGPADDTDSGPISSANNYACTITSGTAGATDNIVCDTSAWNSAGTGGTSTGGIRMVFSANFAAVPVPAAVWLFGSALGLLGWVRRRATV